MQFCRENCMFRFTRSVRKQVQQPPVRVGDRVIAYEIPETAEAIKKALQDGSNTNGHTNQAQYQTMQCPVHWRANLRHSVARHDSVGEPRVQLGRTHH